MEKWDGGKMESWVLNADDGLTILDFGFGIADCSEFGFGIQDLGLVAVV